MWPIFWLKPLKPIWGGTYITIRANAAGQGEFVRFWWLRAAMRQLKAAE
jgi:hypothetical protein